MPGRALIACCSLCAAVAMTGVASGQSPPLRPKAPKEPVTVDAEASLGGHIRVGDAQALEVTERVGLTFGVGLRVSPTRSLDLGLSYEHVDLGRERSSVGPFGHVELERDLSNVWASLRVYLLPPGDVRLFVGLGLGLSWQSADASGATPYGPDPYLTRPFTCEGSDSAGFAFAPGAGVEARLDGRLYLVGDSSFRAYRLSSDVLDSCAPGTGTVDGLALRANLQYRWDVSR